GLENQAYPQGIFLRQSYEIAKAVAVKSIIEQGFQGAQIREELTKQRVQAVEEWLKIQKVMI
ncbi:MAG: multifunctional CCA tRNA nucleotidyl transferase/2'3'-cyclic phosphodiesterase/2'nucleotidase/phosphatase, partial [Providencia alcalifaciens]|nr:multifunctional CCA tRNA nucleotidyl transferase/2'3'-cyclic phosphodiesterase/2'nucleotidase/phosphatase [Providencia alcalifaciens]